MSSTEFCSIILVQVLDGWSRSSPRPKGSLTSQFTWDGKFLWACCSDRIAYSLLSKCYRVQSDMSAIGANLCSKFIISLFIIYAWSLPSFHYHLSRSLSHFLLLVSTVFTSSENGVMQHVLIYSVRSLPVSFVQWFSTLLTLWPFNRVLHAMVTPSHRMIFIGTS